MGSIPESDIVKYEKAHPVNNICQSTYLQLYWQTHGDVNDIMLRELHRVHQDDPHLQNIIQECNTFYKHNRYFVKSKYTSAKNSSLYAQKLLLNNLLWMKHYLLAFTLSIQLAKDNDTHLSFMLKALKYYN